jgi:lantibiotic modifying enzyme
MTSVSESRSGLAATQTRWRAVLPEAMRPQALKIVHHIAHALPSPKTHWNGSLSGGLAGYALFHAFYALSKVDHHAEAHRPDAANSIEAAVDRLPHHHAEPSFYSGFVGIAWAVEWLQNLGLLDPTEDYNAEMDESLLEHLETQPLKTMLPELIGGLAGLGLYAADRVPRHPAARALLQKVLDCFEAMAERGPAGITWFNPPEALHPKALEMTPEGHYNFGLSHGMPGAIGFLAEAHALGERRALPLLEGAVAWLLSMKRNYANGSHFTYGLDLTAPGKLDQPKFGSRIAWCYGDLGIAAVLMVAAQQAGREDWAAEAVSLAKDVAARGHEGSGCMDAGLCHGAFGNAHIFNRLYQASGDPVLLKAFESWMQQGFEMRKPGEGLAGYYMWSPASDEEAERSPWVTDPGLLEGVAGIGLALLAALTNQEPHWDRFLMVHAAPKGL